MAAVGKRIVAAVAEPRVEPQPPGFARDVRLAQMLERRVDGELPALAARLGRKPRQLLEPVDELGPAIRDSPNNRGR